MSNSILFVCKSCNFSGYETKTDKPSDGTLLVNQLLTLYQNWSRRSELDIQPVECLWTCAHPCAVALSCSYRSHLTSIHLIAV